MKKLFTSIEYKRRNKKHAAKSMKMRLSSKAKRKSLRRGVSGAAKNVSGKKAAKKSSTHVRILGPAVAAPADFRLIENTQECLLFFKSIRSEDCVSRVGQKKFVLISIAGVTQIDYGTVSVLIAISDDLSCREITLQGDFPRDENCMRFIADSGFLNYMVDEHNNPFPKAQKSDLLFFEKGQALLSHGDNVKISSLIRGVVKHLTGVPQHFLPLKTILLEICGNSIEWSGVGNKQWLLGVKYEPDKVIFTVTDVGRGILETLYRKFTRRISEPFKPDDEILKGAFCRRYGSATQQVNRNKGLPSVKASFEDGSIAALKVLTNNVILHFDNASLSNAFASSQQFEGTFYQWEINRDCINKKNN
jgi:hypothetical protein